MSDDETSSSESDWEEVHAPGGAIGDDEVEYIKNRLENPLPDDNEVKKSAEETNEPSTSSGTLKILVPGTGALNKKRRKKQADIIGNYIVREINKCKREVYRDLHRVGLLCLLARGLQYNGILRQESILATALSLLPSERSYPPKNLDLSYIEKFLSWFKGAIKLTKGPHASLVEDPAPITLEKELLEQMGKRTVNVHTLFVFIFIATLRALGVQVRLVWNLVPPPIKPESVDLMKLLKPEGSDASPRPSSSKERVTKSKSPSVTKSPPPKEQEEGKRKKSEHGKLSSGKKGSSTGKSSKKLKKAYHESSEFEISEDDDGNSSDSDSRRRRKVPKKGNTRAKGNRNSKKPSSSSSPAKKSPATANTSRKSAVRTNTKPGSSKRKFEATSDEETKQKSSTSPVKSKVKVENNFWPEVFLEEEEQWVSVDILECKVLSDATLRAKATQPICYVIAFSNAGHVKDVTSRYSERWWTELGKLRDDEWWVEATKPYRGRKTIRDRNEDNFLEQHLQSLPLPTTIAAFKNHPLYVIRRHLLKYEAIYPPDVIPCGFIRNEQVYPRSSVHTLNGRENWLRKARVVRIGEKPYKTVKARPKFTKNLGMVAAPEDQPLELFGEWQTEDYQPPLAVDGKVPRNAFGNVDLYMAKMLPIGTIHLQLPGLSRVARKLDVDCAPAVVGFEFNAGGCHPKFDGFVVCEEFKEILLDAWNQDQDEIKKREDQRRLKRIYDRWEKLCKGLLIREKLEKRYAYTFNNTECQSGRKTNQAVTQKIKKLLDD